MPEQIEWVCDESRFGELASEWDRLARDEPTPFARHGWFASWWRAFGSPTTLRICVLWRDGRMAGVLPLHRRGRRLKAMANVHTPVFAPVAADRPALDTMLDAALTPGGLTLEVPALPASGVTTTALLAGAYRARRPALGEAQHSSPKIEVRGDFDAFRRETKGRWGAPLERFGRKMQREHGARFSLVEAPVDLDDELRRGFAVEASGWKGTAGTAIISSPRTEIFYRTIAQSFAARDGLRLSGIFFDDRLVAFDLSLLHARRLWLLKTGFDESFRRLAPGLVLRLRVIERCFELGLEGHELLGGDAEWKRKFATDAREHQVMRVYGRHPAGITSYAYRRAARPRLVRAYRSVQRTLDARARGG